MNKVFLFIKILLILIISIFIKSQFIFPYHEIGDFFFPFNNNIFSYKNINKISKIYEIKGYFLNNLYYLQNGILLIYQIANNKKELVYFSTNNYTLIKIKEFYATNIFFNSKYLITVDYSKSNKNGYEFNIYEISFTERENKLIFKSNKLQRLFIKEIINDLLIIDDFIYYTYDSELDNKINLNLIDIKKNKILNIFSISKNMNFLKINFFNYQNETYIILNTSTANNNIINNGIFLVDHSKLKNFLHNNKEIYFTEKNFNFNNFITKLSLLNIKGSLFSKNFINEEYIFFQTIDNEGITYLFKFKLDSLKKNKFLDFNISQNKFNISAIYNILKIENSILYYISYNYFRDKNSFYFVIFDLKNLKELFKYKLY